MGLQAEKYRVLKEYFGHTEFRSGQEDIIDSILSKRDAVGIMPTGAGKSMCYQIPALIFSGITVVISPLISLMKDQVNALTQSGVAAAYINSSLTMGQYRKVLQNITEYKYKIIYVAPERLLVDDFVEVCKGLEISFVAVDEAHCVSQWGQDFRPSYLKIPQFISKLTKRPVTAAFTATATKMVKEDIVNYLELQEPFSLITGFDRPNLYFSVIKPEDKLNKLLRLINERKTLCGIIYCSTRRNVEQVCDVLNENGIAATRYHAGLTEDERIRNQDDFVFDRKSVMVATNAFGMGIDKSNVSYIIHYNMPKNLESYYQEAGRAGRDGSKAECILLYSPKDVHTAKFIIENAEPNAELSLEQQEEVKQREYERLKYMTFYSTTRDCLRAYMLRYFGEQPSNFCGRCSNCIRNFVSLDITIDSQKILSCVVRMGQRFGVKMLCDVLRGEKNERISSLGFDALSTYGIMCEYSEAMLRQVINSLVLQGYLEQYGDDFPSLRLTNTSIKVLRGEISVEMKMLKESTFKMSQPASVADSGLLQFLKERRKKIAARLGVPAYVVFTDATLTEMCIKQPQNLLELSRISGVGEVKLNRFGKDFVNAISEYNAKQ